MTDIQARLNRLWFWIKVASVIAALFAVLAIGLVISGYRY